MDFRGDRRHTKICIYEARSICIDSDPVSSVFVCYEMISDKPNYLLVHGHSNLLRNRQPHEPIAVALLALLELEVR